MKKLINLILSLAYLLALVANLPAFAGLAVTAGTGTHAHTDANTGGATLTPTSLIVSGDGTSTATGMSNGDIKLYRTGGGAGALFLNSAGTKYLYNSGTNFLLSGSPLILDNTLSSTKACASGYTRATPNLCMKLTNASTTALVRDTLTTLTLPSADAKAVLVQTGINAYSANAVALRYATVRGYSDGATGLAQTSQCYAPGYEFVATVATAIGGAQCLLLIPGTTPSLKFEDDAGNGGDASYEIRGYPD